MFCNGFRVIKTTGNIEASPPPSISREVWAKPIMFIGTRLCASLTNFQVEVKGRTPENKQSEVLRNREL